MHRPTVISPPSLLRNAVQGYYGESAFKFHLAHAAKEDIATRFYQTKCQQSGKCPKIGGGDVEIHSHLRGDSQFFVISGL